ncbi:hypothetical protein [Eisenibacter elegans]|jgi:hypothetical protein|uniref:hypothetical protein n=1 Tax=Eisenibacter elegans TaxID=997 RepID=UPI0004187ACE|nr:hypothetical protein [Eisenibacter elegans]
MENIAPKLFIALADWMYQQGFSLLNHQQQFRRNTDQGFWSLIPSVSLYEGVCKVEVNFGVRHHHIEQWATQFMQIPMSLRADTATLQTSLGKLLEQPYLRYEINHESEIKLIGNQIEEVFLQKALPWMQACDSLTYLHQLLNTDPDKPCRYIHNQQYRCFRGQVVAWRLRSPDFEKLALAYTQSLKRQGATEPQRRGFERMCQILRTTSWN